MYIDHTFQLVILTFLFFTSISLQYPASTIRLDFLADGYLQQLIALLRTLGCTNIRLNLDRERGGRRRGKLSKHGH
jgi:hypothetical protein